MRDRLFHQLDNKNGTEPSAPKRRGPGIRVGGAAHAIWMNKMMKGEKPSGRPGKSGPAIFAFKSKASL